MKKVLQIGLVVVAILALMLIAVACGKTVDIGVDFIVDGTTYVQVSTTGQETISLPKDPTKDGYVFRGWYWDKDVWSREFTVNSLMNQPLTESIKVYAYFITQAEADSIKTVTFNTMGAGSLDPIEIKNGNLLAEPAALTKEGYLFVGWFREADFTTKWNFKTDLVQETMTLYAKWVEDIPENRLYTVAFNSNGGTAVASITEIPYNTLIQKPANPTNGDYALVGWYKDNTFAEEWNFELDRVTENRTLYARYQQADVTACALVSATGFTIDDKNLSIKVANGDETFSFLERITVSPFASWTVVNDLQGKDAVPSGNVEIAVGDNTKYILITSYDGLHKSFYTATIHRRLMYAVSLIHGNDTEDDLLVPYEEDSLISFPELTRTGYTLTAWLDEEGEAWDAETDTVQGDVTLTADWSVNTYAVSFDSAEGSEVEDAEATYDAAFTFTVPERTGYAFLGWTYEDELLTDGTGASLAPWTIDEAVTLVASWSEVVYSIAYENLKGAANENAVTYTITQEVTFTALSQNGYTFNGWKDEAGEEVAGIAVGSIGNRTITADWDLITYTATFLADGEVVDTREFNVETLEVVEPTIPTKVGYTSAWANYDFPANNIYVNAIYTPIVYTVTYAGVAGAYDIDTPVNTNPTTYTIESAAIIFAAPSKSGYTFDGWTDEDEQAISDIPALSTGNRTITAHWTAVSYDITYNGLTGDYDVDTPVNMNETSYTIESAAITLADASKTGYTFDGWTDEQGAPITAIPANTIGNRTITAHWSPITYTITYAGVAGAYDIDTPVNANPTSYTIESAAIIFATPSKSGYTFDGWTDEEEQAISEIPALSTGNRTITAHWTAVSYDITYAGLTGDYDVDVPVNMNETSYTIESAAITLADASKTGYTFDGWTDEAGAPITAIPANTIGNRTITAHWSPIVYMITYAGVAGAYDIDTPVNTNPATYTIESAAIIFAAPSKSGYTFDGWTDEEEQAISEIPALSTGNRTITAHWTAVSYDITYAGSTGDYDVDTPVNMNETSYTIESAAITLADASKTGYTFDGWTDEQGAKITSIPANTIGNRTITAHWSPITYTITYAGVAGAYDIDTPVNANPTSYTIESAAIIFATPSKSGYTFDGWTDEEEQAISEIPALSTGNRTITAHWTAVSYDITYAGLTGDYDVDVPVNENETSYTIESAAITLADASKTGYTFDGWTDEQGAKITSIPANTIGNRTITAHWTPITYTVTYAGVAGAYDIDTPVNNNPKIYTIESAEIVLTNASKSWYTFNGWTENDLPVTSIASKSTGNKTLTANWSANTYAIHFIMENELGEYEGHYEGEENPTSYTVEDSFDFIEPVSDIRGYTFKGWYTTKNEAGNKVERISHSTGEKTYYAQWTREEYSISYYGIDNATNTNLNSYNVDTETFTLESPTRLGYTFIGWYAQKEYLTIADTTIEQGSVGNLSFYAKWELTNYTIEYVLYGGDNNDANPDTFTMEDSVTFRDPTRVDYTFGGWFTDSNFTEGITEIHAGYTGNVTIYAKWHWIATVTFDSNGGSAVSSITQDYNTFVDAPADPARTGYRFLGWYKGNSKYTFSRMPAGNIGLTARWETISYSISYALNGGTNGSNPSSYTIESNTITLANASKRGYEFVGWYVGEDKITQIAHGSYGVVELQARFEILHYTITYHNVVVEANANPATYTVEDAIIFQDIEKLGHTYHGLYTESNFINKKTGISQGSVGNIVLYAKYTVNDYDLWMDGKEDPEYTVSFDVVGGNQSYATQTITPSAALAYPGSPTKNGFIFAGWYDNAEYEGTTFAFNGEINHNVVLYAKWISTENQTISVNSTVAVAIQGKTEYRYSFVPLVSGDISVTTTGSVDTYGALYEDATLVKQDDDTGSDANFLIKYNVTAGKVYTVSVRGYSVSTAGNVTLSVSGNSTVAAGGKAQAAGNKITVTFGSSFALSAPTKNGYVFRGWADENGVMYTDESGASIKNFDKTEETVFYSVWEVDGFTISFVTNGGTSVAEDTLACGARLDINRYVTTRANYAFLGWYLSASDAESYNATVMPDHDVVLYAKWTSYNLNAIKYDTSVNYISEFKEITVEDFGATCFDNSGNLVPLTIAVNGTQTAGSTITVRFTATQNGKTKTATISGVKVYGNPSLMIGNEKGYINLNEECNAAWFETTATDTYGESIAPVVIIASAYSAGDTIAVKISATDIAGNTTEQTIQNVKVYGSPVIASGTITAIKASDTLTPDLLAVTAQDSFGVALTPAVSLFEGTQTAGNTVKVKLYAVDAKGNATTEYIDVKVYGNPVIAPQTAYDFKVTDVITVEALGISATDSHGGEASVVIALTNGTQVAGATLTYSVTATDLVGNVSVSTATAKIYGAPTVSYDRDNVLVNEETVVPVYGIGSSVLSFNLNGGTSGKPADQTITATQGMTYPSSVPTRSGYVFKGWYTTASCTALFDFTKAIDQDVTVYAGWVSYSGAGILPLNGTVSNISAPSKSSTSSYKYYAFVPLVSGTVTIYSSGSSDSYGYLYNSGKTQLTYNDDGGSNSNFSISYAVTAGTLYYVAPCAYGSSNITLSLSMNGASYPAAGGKSTATNALIGYVNTLNAVATDSFGLALDVTVSVHSGDVSKKGTYVTYDITATDHLGNTATVITAPLGVYDIEDIRNSLTYNAFNTDKIKLSSRGEEFDVTAIDSFGQNLTISVKKAGGGSLVAGQVQNIVLVATDVAGNSVTSDVISNIGVYDLPTITYDSDHIFDNGVCYNKTGEELEFLFVGHDSFGEELYVDIEILEETADSLSVSATVTDDAGNAVEQMWSVIKLVGKSYLTLYDGDTYIGHQLVTIGASYDLPNRTGYSVSWKVVGAGSSLTDEGGHSLAVWSGEETAYRLVRTTQIITYSVTYTLNGGTNDAGNVSSYTIESVGSGFTLLDPAKVTNEEVTGATALGNGLYRVTKNVTAYTFLGWYTESGFVNRVTEIAFGMGDVALFAKWSVTTSVSSATDTEKIVNRNGNYITFGTYPQTKVTDSSITNALNTMAGTLPTASNSRSWTSYGYYISGSVSNYMWYIDLEYSGEKYRGVYFKQFRPNYTNKSSSDTYQDDNGYYNSIVYWFKYEPIMWRILSEADGEALILCSWIIDSQEFYNSSNDRTINGQTVYASNYAESNIRKWLNDTFYNTAFTDLQKQLIVLTTVDNSARSTNPNNNATEFNNGTNTYACANTQDYVFLLSEQEVTNSDYGFSASCSAYDTARQKKSTDYAKSQGVFKSTSSGYVGNCYWWLRSPSYGTNSYGARLIENHGRAEGVYSVYSTSVGVVPALRIKL